MQPWVEHEREKKEKAHLRGTTRRGSEAAALEAVGAALGSLGLVAFGLVVWQMVGLTAVGAFIAATAAWLIVSIAAWMVRKRYGSAAVQRANRAVGMESMGTETECKG